MKTLILINIRKIALMFAMLFIFSIYPSASHSADVIILGNSKLKPVADVINGIQRTIRADITVISNEDEYKSIESIVRKENASAVIALGTDAAGYALSLPESIPVVYGLLIDPLETDRKNITGVYMSTPISEYIFYIKKNFPDIKKIGIICPQAQKKQLEHHGTTLEIEFRVANNPYEFIDRLSSLSGNIDAFVLLPERDLITTKVLEKLYLFSFKEKIPVIGISEKYVKIGSLFSLGFDTTEMGMQIGEMANMVLSKGSASGIPQSHPDRLDLYINSSTSEAMRVNMPETLLKTAKKVYP